MQNKTYRFNTSLRLLFAFFLIFFTEATNTGARAFSETTVKTIRVAPTGVDGTGCGSISQPCSSIQYAVNSASSGDTILVAEGVYTYKQNYDNCSFLVTASVICYVNKSLTINGGYSIADWNKSDTTLHPTIIDGQNQWRGVAVIAYNSPAKLTMQGFTIRNGRAFGRSSGDEYSRFGFGGGFWAQHSSINLKDIIFQDNITFGGSNSSIANGGWALGGGLAIEGPQYGASSYLENISFIGNQALGGNGKDSGGIAEGGGIFIGQSTVTATGLTFTANVSKAGSSSGNGVDPNRGLTADSLGGAIAVENNSVVNFYQIQATDNQSIGGDAGTISQATAGGGFGGAIHTEYSSLTLTDSYLGDNQAIGGTAAIGGYGLGGAILSDKSQIALNRARIVANTAIGGNSFSASGKKGAVGGGGAYLTSFSSTGSYQADLTNCLFADNSAVLGDVGATGTGGGGGGGLVVQSITANATQITFANNSLGPGLSIGQAVTVQALYAYSGKPAVLNLKYSIISDHNNPYTSNTSALTNLNTNTANLSYVWFGNNTNHTNENGAPLQPGIFVLDHIWKQSVSAGFVSTSHSDPNYHLRPDSSVIDLGFNSPVMIDLDKLSRPVGPIQDLGAYEFSLPTLKAEHPSMGFLVDSNQTITVEEQITVNIGEMPVWTASANVNWISLSAAPTKLTIQIDPTRLSLGTHSATITLSSDTAEPATIEITLSKVLHVYRDFLPAISN
jgi:hypothetical protein